MNEIRAEITEIKVLLGAESPLFRQALRASMDLEPDICVVADSSDWDTLGASAQTLRPDVAILEATEPAMCGVRVCAEIKRDDLATKVLVFGPPADHAALRAAVEAGADGYLGTDAGVDELVAVTRHLFEGQAWIPPSMLGDLLRDLIQRGRDDEKAATQFDGLSRRERQILHHLVDGLDSQAIATELFVSRHTVRTHIQNILDKLGVHSQVQAVAFAVQHGFADPE